MFGIQRPDCSRLAPRGSFDLLLGVTISCLYATNASADEIIPPKIENITKTGVSLPDGSFSISDVDLQVGPLRFMRYHLGGRKDTIDEPFGAHMSHSFDMYVQMNRRPAFPFSCGVIKGDSLTLYGTDDDADPGMASLLGQINITPCLVPDRFKPIVHMGTKTSGTFIQDINPPSNPRWSSDESRKGFLELIQGQYRYTDNEGVVYNFSSNFVTYYGGVPQSRSQRILSIDKPSGERIEFAYDSASRLKLITDSVGYSIVIERNSVGLISKICGFNMSINYVGSETNCSQSKMKHIYEYSGKNLISHTDNAGAAESYNYSGSQISCIIPAGRSTCRIQNIYGSIDHPWQVTRQILADNSIWSYSYGGAVMDNVLKTGAMLWEEPYNYTVVTQPDGVRYVVNFNKTSPYSLIGPLGEVTAYKFWGGFESEQELIQGAFESGSSISPNMSEGEFLMSVTYPEGNKLVMEYNGPFLALSRKQLIGKSGDLATAKSVDFGYSYECAHADKPSGNCPKPIWRRDEKGQQTDYAFATHGGILSEMAPAPVSGAPRPLKLTTWLPRYAWIMNSVGTLVQAANPIWTISSEVLCQTAPGSNSPVCDANGTAPKVTTVYEYGDAASWRALHVKGKAVTSGRETLRTCYTYDEFGRKVSETAPNAALAACP